MAVATAPKAEGAKRCSSPRKQGRGPCTQAAGWGTQHPGEGRCKLHGGNAAIKHGRYSTILHRPLAELLAKHDADPEWRDLKKEASLVRAMLELYVAKFGDRLEDPALAAGTAAVITGLVERARRVIETIEKVEAANAITQPDFFRLVRQMGVIVEAHVEDEGARQKIAAGWAGLQFFPQQL